MRSIGATPSSWGPRLTRPAKTLRQTEGMPVKFLIAAIVGLVLALNARRALRSQLVLVPAFFASWLVMELAPQLLLLLASGVVLFCAGGGLAAWPGWVAIALAAIT